MYNNVTFLCHHGTKGQKWGQRKYQNSDGSLTALGRLHYGVGNARKAVGSVATKAGSAIKKKVAPSDADLQEKYQKALRKQQRHELKEATKEANRAARGKGKKIKNMSDEEVRQNIQRLQNEEYLKNLQKERKTSTKVLRGAKTGAAVTGKIVGTGAKFTSRIAGATLGAAGKFLATSAGTLATQFVQAGAKKLVSKAFEDKDSVASEKLRREATDSKNSLDFMKNMLSMQALSGDKEAAERLKEFNSINSKNKDKGNKDNGNKDNGNNGNNGNKGNGNNGSGGKKKNVNVKFPSGDKPGYDYSDSRDNGFRVVDNMFSGGNNSKNRKEGFNISDNIFTGNGGKSSKSERRSGGIDLDPNDVIVEEVPKKHSKASTEFISQYLALPPARENR